MPHELAPDLNPAGIEASMRLHYGMLNHLPRETFMAEAKLVAELEAHLFHPTEGRGTGAMFGHGPIFRDLNVSVDSDAVGTVLAMHLPLTLIPYDAARTMLITDADLDSLARTSPAGAWVAQTARDWLAFWNNDVGLPGFYPFDWVATAYLTDPGLFNCATLTARMAREWTFWVIPHQSLVVETTASTGDTSGSRVLYCPETSASLHAVLLAR